MAKGFKSGGRRKGVRNKENRKVEEIAAQFDLDPFEVLMMIVNNDWEGLGYDSEVYFVEKPDGATKMGYVISPEMRANAAKEASKYLYSQKKAVELSTGEQGIKIVIEDYKKKGSDGT